MGMKYVTLADLSNTIRKNLWKIPRDIDFVVGVPRSGMISASIISSFLNVPLTDTHSLVAGLKPYGGKRIKYFKSPNTGKALVVDDTVWGGGAMRRAKEMLEGYGNFVYMCVYLEGRGDYAVDIWLEDLREYTDNFTQIVLYEWNILQHHPKIMSKCLFDIDGVFCPDPPDERNEDEYLNYIKNAPPLFIPRTPAGGIITYRFEKNRKITEYWLKRQGIQYKELIMYEDEKREISPYRFKGEFFRNNKYNLFVESNDRQARKISDISGKPVYCVETNRVYQ